MPTQPQLGDLEMASQHKKKRTSFDITNTPIAQRGQAPASPLIADISQPTQQVPGNADRARRMQAQFDQPVTKGVPPSNLGGADGLAAGGSGSSPLLHTVKPAPVQEATQALANNPLTAPVQPAQSNRQGFALTGIGVGAQGGEIAARRNENGVTEFSNDPAVVAGAQTMPAGGIGGQPLRTPGVSNMADDVPLAQRGSINNVGNGIGGGLSVGAPGDAALAIGRFERANQEREKMIQASRRGVIGEGGGRVTVVRDSSRSPTLADRQRVKIESRQAETDALLAQTQQGIAEGAERRITEQLRQRQIGQEIQVQDLGYQRELDMNGILAGLSDPNLQGDARTQAERNYLLQAAPSAYASLSTRGANPLSAAVQRLEDEDLSAIGSAQTMNNELARIDSQIERGDLNLGLLANAKSTALNAIGAGDQNAQNYASLNSTLEKLRNESLRLNTGVQTEGDAQRAWNELVTNLKNPELVRQRLAEISALNERAITIRSGIINNRRSGQGASPLDVDSVLGQPAPRAGQNQRAATGSPVSIESDGDYEALPSGSLFIAPDGTTRRKP